MFEAVSERYHGLKVFKDDPKLLDEVKYNGCESYDFKGKPMRVAHFYTEEITGSTFCIIGRPDVEKVRKKIIEVHHAHGVERGN